jgi:hypothetical protein
MITHKKERIRCIYKGISPVNEEEYGNKKYINYPHLFTNVQGGSFWYSTSRARRVPEKLPKDKNVIIEASFNSSILSNIKLISIIK